LLTQPNFQRAVLEQALHDVFSVCQTSRDFVIPNQQEMARETTGFDLITWVVVKTP